MSAWIVVPCLLVLREEFNAASPDRDKGADGTIGDLSHASSSDHSADEDSDVLRDRDADNVNEVHGLDIDSTGPWPEPGWFPAAVQRVVDQQRAELADGDRCRLQYVIWDQRIASRTWNWTWRPYTGSSDPHTDHAHFSARYLPELEADRRPWGVYPTEDDMTRDEVLELLKSDEGMKAIGAAVWAYPLPNPYSKIDQPAGTILRFVPSRSPHDRTQALVGQVAAAVGKLAGQDAVDEQALAEALAPAVAAAVLAAIPAIEEDITPEALQQAIVGALRELATPGQ